MTRNTTDGRNLKKAYTHLLEMPEKQKRLILEELGAKCESQLSRNEKAAILESMAGNGQAMTKDTASIMQAFKTDAQRLLALDVLRESVQVVSVNRLGQYLGMAHGSRNCLKECLKACYVAFTTSKTAVRRINITLLGIGNEIQASNEYPECVTSWICKPLGA